MDNKSYCMKTPRTCTTCKLKLKGGEHDDASLNESVAERFIGFMLIMFEVLRKFQAPPEVVSKIREDINKRRKGKIPDSVSTEVSMIEVGKKRYKYYNYDYKVSEDNRTIIDRDSPCEHFRREHYRHLKNGKVVYIGPITVNKGKGKKIYKV